MMIRFFRNLISLKYHIIIILVANNNNKRTKKKKELSLSIVRLEAIKENKTIYKIAYKINRVEIKEKL